MSLLDSFKSSMVDIVEEIQKGNVEFADELLERLFNWLDEELTSRSNFDQIHRSIADITAHLSVVSQDDKKEAEDFYQNLTNVELREALVKFYSAYLRSYSLENYPLSCKCVFQQIESLVSYLLFKRNVIDRIISNLEIKGKYEAEISATFKKPTQLIANAKGGYDIPLFVKLWFVSDEYFNEFKLLSTGYDDIRFYSRANKDSYKKCYELRNHDSHGLIFGSNDATQLEVADFKKKAAIHLQAPIRLVGFLTQLAVLVQSEQSQS